MTIYVVKQGDTIASVASANNVSPVILAENNGLENETPLVVGQTIVIQIPETVHTVKAGETVESIAAQYKVTPKDILRNNPRMRGSYNLFTGEELVIHYQDEGSLGDSMANGYAFPFIDKEVLRRTLVSLSYLILFTYGFSNDGELVEIDDADCIAMAKEYGVKPYMLISTLTPEGTFSDVLAHKLLNDEKMQDVLIQNILNTIKEKGYEGLDIDFEFLPVADRDKYTSFVAKIKNVLNEQGYEVMVALAPKSSADQPGLIYEGHDYGGLGAAANEVLVMTYEWGYTYGPPMPVSPINEVRKVLDYAVTEIPRNKIFMGVPNYGYDWTLPFVRGTSRAKSIGNVEAVDIARKYKAEIKYDTDAQAANFSYKDEDGKEHMVWFEDARSIDAKIRLVKEYGLRGFTYWNLMKYFPQNWLVVNDLYNITV